MDDGIVWWPLDDVRKGDLKELQGLFDKGVLTMATPNLNKGGEKARFISSKVVRRSKNQVVKSRMCLRDSNRGRPEGGELFATTPSLMSVRMLLTIASWTSLKVPNFVALVGDVTQAFVHAPIYEWIQTRVPDSLNGLEVRINGVPVVLQAGMLLDVQKALYGYRKTPRLWQDWITDKLMQIPLRRSKVEPSIFYNDEKTIFAAMHVDDQKVVNFSRRHLH